MNMPFHIGIAVPDLARGLEEFSDLFGVTWRPVQEVPLSLTDEHGHRHDVTMQVTFSLTSPFALELWEAIPGTPLAAPEGTFVHHLGYWTDNFESERQRLTDLGYPAILTSPIGVIHRGPGGLGVEPEDVHREFPSLRDLYPLSSPFSGQPEF
ncbi:VOC family protein [Mycobacterium paraintracellulare]|uniref:VOC family protein n=1 Tax=Mycobacterium paraintracellulare TaxID=1138383 RepID=UPI0019257987|nr:VOC family protein [Mycobacterium paraintracellulare]BCP15562.1 hypothetical protein MINTM021_24710 [Mycobacterium paraintracellulare]